MDVSPLHRPISTLMRATFVAGAEQTIGGIIPKLRENYAGALPVVEDGQLRGVVTERSLADALARGVPETEGVEMAFATDFPTVRVYESGAEALRAFERHASGEVVVLDDGDRVVGVLRASDLFAAPELALRPPLVGGMATPFGVYLTSGALGAGAKGWALVSTGAMLFTILTGASILSIYLFEWLVGKGVNIRTADLLSSFAMFGLFGGAFRFLPIAGIHAAEHMVVHAIERGEPLIPSVVKRMPRVHPRCGTNLAVGGTIFLGIAANKLIQPESLRLTLALVGTLLLWRRLGSWTQYWITTRPPSDKQIEMGIRSGKELLERHSAVRSSHVGIASRLWNSGLFHVMAGSFLVYGIVAGLSALFHWNLPI